MLLLCCQEKGRRAIFVPEFHHTKSIQSNSSFYEFLQFPPEPRRAVHFIVWGSLAYSFSGGNRTSGICSNGNPLSPLCRYLDERGLRRV